MSIIDHNIRILEEWRMPFINVKMVAGRSLEQKRELAEALTREVVRILEVKPEWVELVIDEYSRENWSTAGQLHADKYGPGCGSQGVNPK
ncbi:MAG: tautomerase family protein [Syntrophomonadaceae bacterium]|nr:tautomerase family protein [Syntrophomonadaceae bacterium]